MSANLPVEGYQLKDISPRAFQHPADRAATAALSSVPYLDTVVRKLIELGYERALRQSFLGSAVRLSEQQLPDVWREHAIAYATLDMTEIPDLYLSQFPVPNAMAIGAKRPIVVVQSGLMGLLDAPQRRAVFAHEAAHILSDHGLYRTALQILVLINPLIYVTEGMRAGLTPFSHLHLYIIYPVLIAFTAAFLWLGLRNFRRRVLV